MNEPTPADALAASRAFLPPNEPHSALPHGGGHIHATFAVCSGPDGRGPRALLQRINDRVFRDPQALQDNIVRVTRAVSDALNARGGRDAARQRLAPIPARNGGTLHIDAAGRPWRCYAFIENAVVHTTVPTPETARAVARAFGEFLALAAAIPGPRLHETIAGFHDTRSRFERLREAAAADTLGRLAHVRDLWGFARAREHIVDALHACHAAGGFPERVTHNDSKADNVLFPGGDLLAPCVVDLDTVMPGFALHDFGDLVRTASSPAPEDEPDPARMFLRPAFFGALVRGYLEGTGGILTGAELDRLVLAGRIITLEIGMRFLTDHLEGDVYYRTERPGHNADRCRAQFQLVRSIEEQDGALRRIAEESVR